MKSIDKKIRIGDDIERKRRNKNEFNKDYEELRKRKLDKKKRNKYENGGIVEEKGEERSSGNNINGVGWKNSKVIVKMVVDRSEDEIKD